MFIGWINVITDISVCDVRSRGGSLDAAMAQRFATSQGTATAGPPQQRYPPPPVPALRQYAGPSFPVTIMVIFAINHVEAFV